MSQLIAHEREQTKTGVHNLLRPVDPRVLRAMAFIEEHYQRNLSLKRVAASVNLSIWHLCHLFKAEMGETPIHYLKTIRMRHAQRLLADWSLSIKEVMSKVGMADQSHFAKDFKRVYGVTPSQFRIHLSQSETLKR